MENILANEQILILLRLVLAIVLSFALGLERELTGKFAGLRTHILVCVGACIFTILSIYGFKMHVAEGIAGINDPARIAAQIITGIGFIGAGTVMRHGTNVLGITTAANLWVCAAIGMACGCGEYYVAIAATILTLIVLIAIRNIEKNFISNHKVSYKLYLTKLTAHIEQLDDIEKLVEDNFDKILRFDKKITDASELKISIKLYTKKTLADINDTFKKLNDLKSVEITEIYE